MTYILSVIFILLLAAVIHSYVVFPVTLKLIKGLRSEYFYNPENAKDTPAWSGKVSLIMSCFNEDKVLRDKIACLEKQTFPKGQLNFYIGSDASTDDTNAILKAWEKDNKRVRFYPFEARRGKAPVINELAKLAMEEWGTGKDHVLLFTDANVLLQEDCIAKMIRHFREPGIGVVDSHMSSVGTSQEGISTSEKAYIQREVMIKNLEGVLWGTMMGTFGGCYMVRSNAFAYVPEKFLVDDFFITLEAILKGFGAINDLEARCFEAVPHEIEEEYRRKRRISSGNFQNLGYFWPRIRRSSLAMQYCFISHKVLRWLGPIFVFTAWIISGWLWMWGSSTFGWIFAFLFLGTTATLLIDRLLEVMKVHFPWTRHLRYFIWMNIAVFEGFIQYLYGIKSNVWQPPKRQ